MAGVRNLRDAAESAAGLRTGRLYRSAALTAPAEEVAAQLTALGVTRVIDLRDDDEVRWQPSASAGVEVVRVPLFSGSAASLVAADPTLTELYEQLLGRSGERLVAAVRAIVEAPGPVLVHCTVGKDRTGMVVALSLLAAGAPAAHVVADYARTEQALGREWLDARLVELRSLHPGRRLLNLEALATTSPPAVLESVIDRLETHYGGAAGYLQSHGLTAAELDRLRALLVAP